MFSLKLDKVRRQKSDILGYALKNLPYVRKITHEFEHMFYMLNARIWSSDPENHRQGPWRNNQVELHTQVSVAPGESKTKEYNTTYLLLSLSIKDNCLKVN